MSYSTLLLLLIFMHSVLALSYYYDVKLEDDGPIVKGGTIHFTATVYDGNRISSEKFFFVWEDNAIPQHTRETTREQFNDTWTVTYDADKYPLGKYVVQVTVRYCLSILCHDAGSARSEFYITGTLNGDIAISQKNITRDKGFVSSRDTAIHEVNLKKSDADYISTAPTVVTYWFVDCVYYGITTDFKFPFNYTKPDESHILEALVMADFTPLPPPTTVAPNTTTVAPTTTSKPTTSTSKPTTTTSTIKPTTTTPHNTTTAPSITKPLNTTTTMKPTTMKSLAATTITPIVTSAVSKIVKRSIVNNTMGVDGKNSSRIMTYKNGMLVPFNHTVPFVCNGTRAANDNKTYGFFYSIVEVRAPVSNITVSGNTWIQHGEVLKLEISCHGSMHFQYCTPLLRGEYNVTGNETCDSYVTADTCKIPFKRYLREPKYTILVIIKNDVSSVVYPVGITVYEVKKQAQLSVIVVPVAFTLVAVVLIVFGVAYYIQNRSRFIIEVADFNFGVRYSDMEYKSFRERLKDSITNAFTRGPTPSSSEVPVWPPTRK